METQPESAAPEAKSSPKVDALAARREARRKRILENSNNRLTKITGREHNEPPAVDFTVKPPDVIYPDPEVERDEYTHPEQHLFGSSLPEGFPNMANGDIFSLLNPPLSTDSRGSFPATQSPPVPDTALVKFLRTRIHLALMAVLVYLLFANNLQHLIGGSVFILLLGWEMVEVFLLKTYEKRSSFLDVVFLLGGISPKYSQIALKFTQTINKVLKDVTFFVFFFVVTHLLWSRFVLGIELGYVLGYDQLEKASGEVAS
ncbi:AAEL014795-PA [Aedes aegypti]|uniref:AAEL014795-PA n=1 Tax=Aedes aegypti TaxID=7159 RepID=Q16FE5_AEDAE|nr:AAEL014795-PA [Aedes aegypti]